MFLFCPFALFLCVTFGFCVQCVIICLFTRFWLICLFYIPYYEAGTRLDQCSKQENNNFAHGECSREALRRKVLYKVSCNIIHYILNYRCLNVPCLTQFELYRHFFFKFHHNYLQMIENFVLNHN